MSDSRVRVVGTDDVERFVAALSGARPGVGPVLDSAAGLERELAVVTALRRLAPAFAPDAEARDRAKQRLLSVLAADAAPAVPCAC